MVDGCVAVTEWGCGAYVGCGGRLGVVFYHTLHFVFAAVSELVRLVSVFRACWLAGRPGGGKTLLAVVLALELVRMGYAKRIVSNFPLYGGGLVGEACASPQDMQDAVIILDEAWSELGMGQDRALRTWLAYPRKRNQYLLFPSVLPLVRALGRFRVDRVFCGTQVGLPVWVYRYLVDTGDRKMLRGYAPLWGPSGWFGRYDSFALPMGWVSYEYRGGQSAGGSAA